MNKEVLTAQQKDGYKRVADSYTNKVYLYDDSTPINEIVDELYKETKGTLDRQFCKRFEEDRSDHSFEIFRCNLCSEDIIFSSFGANDESIDKDLLEHIISCDIKIRGEQK